MTKKIFALVMLISVLGALATAGFNNADSPPKFSNQMEVVAKINGVNNHHFDTKTQPMSELMSGMSQVLPNTCSVEFWLGSQLEFIDLPLNFSTFNHYKNGRSLPITLYLKWDDDKSQYITEIRIQGTLITSVALEDSYAKVVNDHMDDKNKRDKEEAEVSTLLQSGSGRKALANEMAKEAKGTGDN